MRTPSISPHSYFRVAAATPVVAVGDPVTNRDNITALYTVACREQVALVVFPELCVTGYSIGDLVQTSSLLQRAESALKELAALTAHHQTAMIVGLPVQVGNATYNCAALLAGGMLRGIVPKRNLPTYKEFYEKRWFQSYTGEVRTVTFCDTAIPFGAMLFRIGRAAVGIELCEDLWVAAQPSIDLVARGAHIICNPSASPETVTKADYRRTLVTSTAARLVAGYVYSGADPSESTMDVVMSGHALISENGRLLAERRPFSQDGGRLVLADIDIDHIEADRRKDTNYQNELGTHIVECGSTPSYKHPLFTPDKLPFVPVDSARLDEVLTIQTYGLKKRIEAAGIKKLVLGLSGGLDSTLALLVALRAADLLSIPAKELLLTVTMPGPASSSRTQKNAVRLAAALGITNKEIPISDLAKEQLSVIGHDTATQDITYENTQARLRTALLFNTANQESGMVLGTGDLSEIALGWCTYNGDHMSGYNVNAGVPKTLVRHLVRHAANQLTNKQARAILLDILDTPVSPELTGTAGVLSQETESLIGPYDLHDFFLYYFIRWNDTPEKIRFLAHQAFRDTYAGSEIDRWLGVFLRRFATNQWKRSVMTDGPKVGSVSLSPRGDWRMPSDATSGVFEPLKTTGLL